MGALARSSAGPPAAPSRESLGWTSTRPSEAVQRPGAASKKLWATESVLPTADRFVDVGCSNLAADFALALAVLSRSRLALVVTGRSKLDGIARMEAPAEILAWPLASRVRA